MMDYELNVSWIVYGLLRHVLHWICASLLSRQNMLPDCTTLISRQIEIDDMFDIIMCWYNMFVMHNCVGIFSWDEWWLMMFDLLYIYNFVGLCYFGK